MKRVLFFAAITTVILSSCSTAYQAGQTPDDLYYSPSRDVAAVKEQKRNQEDADQYQEYVSSSDDRYLHMKVANRQQWQSIDNYSYWNDSRYDFSPYNYTSFYNNFGYYNPYYSAMNPYYVGAGWMLGLNYFGAGSFGYGGYNGYGYGGIGGYGGYYNMGWGNPLYTVISYSAPKAIGGTSTSISNISAYRNRYINNVNGNYNSYNGASGQSFSNLVKKVFTGGSGSNGSSSFERPSRSFGNSPSSSSSQSYTPSSSAGGNSGGFKSTGSSASTGRGGKN